MYFLIKMRSFSVFIEEYHILEAFCTKLDFKTIIIQLVPVTPHFLLDVFAFL
jgi:hypothetical protein